LATRLTLDQKSSGSSPDGATKAAHKAAFVVTEGREVYTDMTSKARIRRGALTEQQKMPRKWQFLFATEGREVYSDSMNEVNAYREAC
jgi:hypothetical protein